MAEVIEKTVIKDSSEGVSNEEVPVETKATSFQTVEYLIYFFFGIIDILLVSRFVLKLFGAGVSNGFVQFIYGATDILTAPFAGIFDNGVSYGIQTSSVFEPATLVAIIVYIAMAWGIVKLIQILSGNVQEK